MIPKHAKRPTSPRLMGMFFLSQTFILKTDVSFKTEKVIGQKNVKSIHPWMILGKRTTQAKYVLIDL